MKFTYIVKDQKGEERQGEIDAPSKEVAIINLQGRGFYIIALEAQIGKSWYSGFLSFFNRIPRKDLVLFTRQFATLLDAQISIPDSLKTLYRQTENITLKEALFEIASNVDAGISFSQALSKFENIFSEFYRNMVRSAEISGRLEETFSYLADYLEKENLLSRRVRNSLIYPVILLVIFFIIVVVLITVVVPRLKEMVEGFGAELPALTKIFISFGESLINFGPLIIAALIGFLFVLAQYLRTEEGKSVRDEMFLKMPLFKNIFKRIYLVRLTEAASVLIRGGIPVPTALEIAGKVSANYVYRNIMFNAAEAVRRGESISHILNSYPEEFPSLVVKMIAIGEETGKLDDLLSRMSKFYADELDDDLSGLAELIQPILIVIIAVFVGLMVASILIPIYNTIGIVK